MHNPPHPGRIIKDALPAIPMTVTEFAAHLGVARGTLSRVINGRSGVTPEMSIKVSEAFGLSAPDMLFHLQNDYDFWRASRARRRRIPQLTKIAA